MRYLKYLVSCLIPLAFVACSEDDEMPLNTGNATVSFSQSTIEIKESVTSINLPIVVSGEHNGNIRVTATMTNSSEGLEKDKNVIITTETLNIPAGTETVNLEVRLEGVTNEEIVSGRNITFEIKGAEGASISGQSTCTINILENNPLEGTYTFGGYDPYGTGYLTCNLSMQDGDLTKAYLDFGMGGLLQINLEEIESMKRYNVTIPAGQVVGVNATYGDVVFSYGEINWSLGQIYADTSRSLTGTYDNGVITLNVDPETGVGFYVTAGWFYFYCSTANADGSIIPLTLVKK